MIIDGRAMAKQQSALLRNAVSHLSHTPHLTVVTCAPGFATQKYIGLKKQVADSVGVTVSIVELPPETTTDEVVQAIQRLALQTDGLIVQLPLPTHIDTATVIEAIPAAVDVDGMNFVQTERGFLPPVVAAIKDIAAANDVVWADRTVVLVGEGKLVGKPMAVWARQQGARVQTVTETTSNSAAILQTADIVVSGVGKPGLITPNQLKAEVVLFDAGTAEAGGELKGDCAPECATVASVMTPVPGGIGPLTVVMLLRNVIAACIE